MDIRDVGILDKKAWIIAGGQLIMLDIQTGRADYKAVDCIVESLAIINEANGGKGAVVAASYANPNVGVAVRIFDNEGNLQKKYNVSYNGSFMDWVRPVQYYNSEYYLVGCLFDDYTPYDKNPKFIILRLSDSAELLEIPYDNVLPDSVYASAVNDRTSPFSAALNFQVRRASCDPLFADITIIPNADEYVRLLYYADSLTPLRLSYSGISCNDDERRTLFLLQDAYYMEMANL